MRARHRASQHLPGLASHGLKRRIASPAEKRRPPTLSNPEQSRPGVQGISALLPLSGDRLARFTPGRTRHDRRCIAAIIIARESVMAVMLAKQKGTPRGVTSAAVRTIKDASHRSVMILPQVHLRKPCYDFYFL